MSAQSGSAEDPLPGLQTATFSLCPHMAERVLVSSSFCKDTDPIMGAPPSSNPNYLPKIPPPNTLVTKQDPMGLSQDTCTPFPQPPMSFACLLSVEKLYSKNKFIQRIEKMQK